MSTITTTTITSSCTGISAVMMTVALIVAAIFMLIIKISFLARLVLHDLQRWVTIHLLFGNL